ncbi:hypothetical protein LWI29_008112 [Acer saccharum]|uniref:Uncharacterized protein n=1 Tax=Acer saccharum TaxID=4024 RepID=A0AA39VD89_ACESA|nr:hypothetical protein LWI29_008112 [Acer saccharum]
MPLSPSHMPLSPSHMGTSGLSLNCWVVGTNSVANRGGEGAIGTLMGIGDLRGVLRIGDFTCFALVVLQCSVSEALRVLRYVEAFLLPWETFWRSRNWHNSAVSGRLAPGDSIASIGKSYGQHDSAVLGPLAAGD